MERVVILSTISVRTITCLVNATRDNSTTEHKNVHKAPLSERIFQTQTTPTFGNLFYDDVTHNRHNNATARCAEGVGAGRGGWAAPGCVPLLDLHHDESCHIGHQRSFDL